jgi:hypothetical protein
VSRLQESRIARSRLARVSTARHYRASPGTWVRFTGDAPMPIASSKERLTIGGSRSAPTDGGLGSKRCLTPSGCQTPWCARSSLTPDATREAWAALGGLRSPERCLTPSRCQTPCGATASCESRRAARSRRTKLAESSHAWRPSRRPGKCPRPEQGRRRSDRRIMAGGGAEPADKSTNPVERSTWSGGQFPGALR